MLFRSQEPLVSLVRCRYQKDNHDADDAVEIVPVFISRRQRQARKKPIHRKPRYYWMDPKNLQQELVDFWSQLGITTNITSPTIPNESLLVYYERNDLRAAIVKNGGRPAVSILLNHAPIMPGRWKDAIASSIELQQLLQTDGVDLSTDRPPWTKGISTKESITTPTFTKVNNNNSDDNNTKLWSHHEGRNQKGYWNLQTVIQELYVSI